MNPERVRITDKAHPHYGETGEFRGEVIRFKYWDGKMAKIHLDHCQHGTDACFVSPGQIERATGDVDAANHHLSDRLRRCGERRRPRRDRVQNLRHRGAGG